MEARAVQRHARADRAHHGCVIRRPEQQEDRRQHQHHRVKANGEGQSRRLTCGRIHHPQSREQDADPDNEGDIADRRADPAQGVPAIDADLFRPAHAEADAPVAKAQFIPQLFSQAAMRHRPEPAHRQAAEEDGPQILEPVAARRAAQAEPHSTPGGATGHIAEGRKYSEPPQPEHAEIEDGIEGHDRRRSAELDGEHRQQQRQAQDQQRQQEADEQLLAAPRVFKGVAVQPHALPDPAPHLGLPPEAIEGKGDDVQQAVTQAETEESLGLQRRMETQHFARLLAMRINPVQRPQSVIERT
ncbi:hypothetical protein D3C72_796020 [compost metagenome]